MAHSTDECSYALKWQVKLCDPLLTHAIQTDNHASILSIFDDEMLVWLSVWSEAQMICI